MVEPFAESFVESRCRDSSGDIRPTIVWAMGNYKAVCKAVVGLFVEPFI